MKAAAQMVGLALAGKMAETAGKTGQSRMSRLGVQGPANQLLHVVACPAWAKTTKQKKRSWTQSYRSNFDQAVKSTQLVKRHSLGA